MAAMSFGFNTGAAPSRRIAAMNTTPPTRCPSTPPAPIAAMCLQRFTLTVPAGMAPPAQELELAITIRPAEPLRLRLAARPS